MKCAGVRVRVGAGREWRGWSGWSEVGGGVGRMWGATTGMA